MERGLILLVAALMVYVAPGVQGTAHLSFANDTQVDITRSGCGVTKLCEETPNDCDPAGNNSCLFASLVASTPVAPLGTNLSVELRGDSMGYIALGLTLNASEGITSLFICAQNTASNGSFFFRTMQRNNTDNMLTPTETIVREIRGMVKDNVIKCEFNVPNVNATSTRFRTSHVTTFSILLGNGTTDGTGLGPFSVLRDSGPQNLANPATTMAPTTMAPTTMANTTMANTTMAGNSTSGSTGAVHPHAVQLLLGVLTLTAMLGA